MRRRRFIPRPGDKGSPVGFHGYRRLLHERHKDGRALRDACGCPSHFVPGGKTVDELPLDKFIGKAFVIDVRGGGEGPVRLEEIPDSGYYGKIVLFLTGGRELSPPEVALFLVAEGVKAVGTDYMTIGGDETTHTIFLSEEIPIFENLANLEEVLGREFTFIAFPLKIEGGSGSPVRAVAILG